MLVGTGIDMYTMNKIIIVFGILLFNALWGFAARKKDKGPYKAFAEDVRICNKTVLPLSKNPPIVYAFGVMYDTNKTKLVRGNATFLRTVKDLELRASGYLWTNGKWRSHITFPTLTCNMPMVLTILGHLTNLKNGLNPDECSISKGTYYFIVNTNWIDHLWAQERAYGHTMWKFELTNKYNSIACVIVTENVIYAKQ